MGEDRTRPAEEESPRMGPETDREAFAAHGRIWALVATDGPCKMRTFANGVPARRNRLQAGSQNGMALHGMGENRKRTARLHA